MICVSGVGHTSGGSGGAHGGNGGRGSGNQYVGQGYDSMYYPTDFGGPGGHGTRFGMIQKQWSINNNYTLYYILLLWILDFGQCHNINLRFIVICFK